MRVISVSASADSSTRLWHSSRIAPSGSTLLPTYAASREVAADTCSGSTSAGHGTGVARVTSAGLISRIPFHDTACQPGQRGGSGHGERRIPQGGLSLPVPGRDHALNLGPRPRALEDPAHGARTGFVQSRITDHAAELARLRRV